MFERIFSSRQFLRFILELDAYNLAKKHTKFYFVPHRHYNLSVMETEGLMLCKEISDVYCENHTEHTNTTNW